MPATIGEAMGGTVVGTAEKSRPAKAKSLRRVEIELADNGGFIVTVQRRENPSARMTYVEPTRKVFEDYASLERFLSKTLTG